MIPVHRHRRVDWSRVIDNLMRSGLTLAQIADHVGVSRRTIGSYRDGDLASEPAFWAGLKLLMLWAQRVQAPLTDAPMRNVQPSVSEMLRSMR